VERVRGSVGDLWQDEKEVERGVRFERNIEEEGSRSRVLEEGREGEASEKVMMMLDDSPPRMQEWKAGRQAMTSSFMLSGLASICLCHVLGGHKGGCSETRWNGQAVTSLPRR